MRAILFGLTLSLLAFGGGAQAVVAQAPHATEGDQQFWFVNRQLRSPVVFELPGYTEAECPLVRINLEPSGSGSVSPAIPVPTWTNGACQVVTFWELSNEVGTQHLVAEGGDGLASVVTARARRGGSVFFGAAYTPHQESYTRFVSEGSAEVETVSPSAAFRPVIGVDFPIWPSLERVRMAVATSVPEVDEYFFFGASLLQGIVFGPAQEGASVDVHVGFQISRRDVAQPCATGYCGTRDLRFSGITFLLTVDGSSAFRGLAGAFLP